jgi:adenylate kinase
LGGRRVCPNCGAIYHIKNKPSAKKGICDICGGKLAIREDDRPEAIKRRLEIYHKQTEPILDKYSEEKKLIKVDASDPIDKVFQKILKRLKKHEQNIHKN